MSQVCRELRKREPLIERLAPAIIFIKMRMIIMIDADMKKYDKFENI